MTPDARLRYELARAGEHLVQAQRAALRAKHLEPAERRTLLRLLDSISGDLLETALDLWNLSADDVERFPYAPTPGGES